MKKLKLIMLLLALSFCMKAQILKPVKWSFNAIKKSASLYEVYMTATVEKGWKIYSQSTPEGGPSPTMVKFKPNPLILLGGKVEEVGEMHKVDEPAFGVQVFYFIDKVDFIQIVKLKKPGVETSLSGTVEFMACDESQCLPPEEVGFEIELN